MLIGIWVYDGREISTKLLPFPLKGGVRRTMRIVHIGLNRIISFSQDRIQIRLTLALWQWHIYHCLLLIYLFICLFICLIVYLFIYLFIIEYYTERKLLIQWAKNLSHWVMSFRRFQMSPSKPKNNRGRWLKIQGPLPSRITEKLRYLCFPVYNKSLITFGTLPAIWVFSWMHTVYRVAQLKWSHLHFCW